LTEPEAAAAQYAARARLAEGQRVAVYDLGGGTFDVCVLEKRGDTFDILGAPDGVEHLGGVDFDEAVFRHVLGLAGPEVAELDPADPLVIAGLARLRRDCVEAKEQLSADVEARVMVALGRLTTTVRVTRSELEELITPALRDTLAATRRALRSASLQPEDLEAVVLVGGSSGIPMVSQLLQEELGVRIAKDAHPKHDIALGAARHAARSDASGTGSIAHGPPAAAAPSAWTAGPGQGQPLTAEVMEAGVDPTQQQPSDARAKPTRWPTRSRGRAASASQPPNPTRAEAATTRLDPPRSATGASTAPARLPTEPPTRTPARLPRPAAASSPSGSPRGERPSPHGGDSSRRFIPIAAGAAAVIAVIAGLWLVLTPDDRDRRAEPLSSGSTETTSPTVTATQDTGLVVAETGLVVPISVAGSVDLFTVDPARGDEAKQLLLDGDSDLQLPSLSPERRTVHFRSVVGEAAEGRVLTADGTELPMMQSDSRDITCGGRLAWHPREPRRVAMLCSDAETGEGTTSAVYLGTVTSTGQVDGGSLEPVPQLRGQPMSNISYTRSGGIVVTFERLSTSPGVAYLPPGDDAKVQQVTEGNDSDSAASSKHDLVAFYRDHVMHVLSLTRQPPPCRDEPQDGGSGFWICPIGTGTEGAEIDPGWSPDGQRVAFRKQNAEGTTDLMVVDVLGRGTPELFLDDLGPVAGAPAWSAR